MLIDNIYFYPPTQLAQLFQCTSLRLSWNGQVQDCTVQIYKIEQGSQGRQRWLILQSQWLFKPTKTITDIGLQNLNNHRSLLYIMWPVVAWSSHPIFPAQLNLRNLHWTLHYGISSGDSGSMRQCVTFTEGYPVLCTTVHKMTNAEEVDTESTLSVFFTRKLWFSGLRVWGRASAEHWIH